MDKETAYEPGVGWTVNLLVLRGMNFSQFFARLRATFGGDVDWVEGPGPGNRTIVFHVEQ